MLRIKSQPKHNVSWFIEPSENIDPEWMLGRFDKEGNLIENEIEVTLDDKQVIIKLYDYFKETFERLPLLTFTIRDGYDMDGKEFQKNLLKKYGNKINAKTEMWIVQYKVLEIGN